MVGREAFANCDSPGLVSASYTCYIAELMLFTMKFAFLHIKLHYSLLRAACTTILSFNHSAERVC